MAEPSDKLWSGRFTKPTGRAMEQFNASIGFDRRLYRVDIQGSRVYAGALEQIGVFEPKERDRVIEGLNQIEQEIETGRLSMTDDLEDIHTAIEKGSSPSSVLSRGSSTRAAAETIRWLWMNASISKRPLPGRVISSTGCRRCWWIRPGRTWMSSCPAIRTCGRRSP